MSLKPFEYHEPNTIQEAATLLNSYGDSGRVIAGGIDLVPQMRVGVTEADHLINIQNIKELMYMDYDDSKGLNFGAMVTLHELELSKVLQEKFPILYESIHQITSVQTKCMGTAVGNLCVSTPSSDVATTLMALDAVLTIEGVNSKREELLADFYPDYRRTTLKRDELVTGVFVPNAQPGEGAVFMNLVRTHCDCAKNIVAVTVCVQDHICKEARIALGSVGPTVFRATAAESLLQGQKITSNLIREVSETAAGEARPITDVRSSKEYRKEMVRTLVGRALAKAYHKTGEQ